MLEQGEHRKVIDHSPVLRLLHWLDYPKINRFNRTIKDLEASEGKTAKVVSMAAIQAKMVLVSLGAYAVGSLLGRPGSIMFAAQAAFLCHQYWAESKLKMHGRLQQTVEQTVANLSAAAVRSQLIPAAKPSHSEVRPLSYSWEKKYKSEALNSDSIDKLVASLPLGYFAEQ